MKYNPGFETDQQIIEHFVVRTAELDAVLHLLHENQSRESGNRHVLIVGPRGSGKTTLVRRVAAHVRKQDSGSALWYPLLFGEEAYEVTSPGEFWLEAVFHLAEQTGDAAIRARYRELRSEMNERRLYDDALTCLMEYADRREQRILLMVENLDMLLMEQIDNQADWNLEETLQNESRIMLLGTATTSFDQIRKRDWSDPELFLRFSLEPLDLEDCVRLWERLTGQKVGPRQVRPLQILTGGNPRLLNILSGFAVNRSFSELMNNLIQLIDDHTDYFKSQLESLSPLERKVFVSLLELWDPSGAREIALQARMDVNKTSALLKRLTDRNAVVVVEESKRKKRYQAAERLYNIYYLMRRRGHPSNRVRAAVSFMVHYYQDDELLDITHHIAREAIELEPEQRLDHLTAFGMLLETSPDLRARARIPERFLALPDLPDELRNRLTPSSEMPDWAEKWLEEHTSSEESGKGARTSKPSWLELGRMARSRQDESMAQRFFAEGVRVYDRHAGRAPHDPKWPVLAGLCHAALGQEDQAETLYRKALDIEPGYSFATRCLAHLFIGNERQTDAETLLREAIEHHPQNAELLGLMGHLAFRMNNLKGAIEYYAAAAKNATDEPWIWNMLGFLYFRDGRNSEAREAYSRAVDLLPEPVFLMNLGNTWLEEQPELAVRKYEEALAHEPADSGIWNNLGIASSRAGLEDKAREAFRKAIELSPDNVSAKLNLADLSRNDDNELALKLYRDCLNVRKQSSDYSNEEIFALAFKRWFDLQGEMNLDQSEMEADIKELLEGHGPAQYNSVAWDLYLEDQPHWLTYALECSRHAVDEDPAWENRHTLATLLAALGRRQEAETVTRDLLDTPFPREQENMIEDFSALFIELAASGMGEEAVALLETSPAGKLVEPLIAGLHIFLGRRPRIAHEIYEVGCDIAATIQAKADLRGDGPVAQRQQEVTIK